MFTFLSGLIVFSVVYCYVLMCCAEGGQFSGFRRTVWFFNALSGVQRSIKPDAYLSSFLRQPRRS